ncbi:polysaccharide deacetylase family protein [Sphingomonas sp.]|uniref:polysaccharide deacetylase family protein n=1 Tax=Sphingomonas sp. TaxID=28214 RepID=UPI0035C84CFE
MTVGRFKRIVRLAAAALTLVLSPGIAQARGTVVLTYDDALPSQLDHALPALDAAGLKATFFLSGVREADVPRWRAAAQRGHELGNHTIFHPCAAAKFPADPRFTSEAYTPATMLREIAQQNVLLRALDGRSRHGFATPCGEHLAGGKDYLEPLRAAKLVDYARGVDMSDAEVRAGAARVDAMHVPARGFGENTTLEQLIAFAREAEASGGWAVYLFHGIGGDYLSVDAAVHRAFIRWLRQHRRTIRVATLRDALAAAR